jgi:hypothetical protein
VATTVLAEETMALLTAMALLTTMALAMLGEETAVATLAVATVTGNRTAVTADEGNGNQCEEHRKGKTEKTLHKNPPPGKKANAAVTNGTPIRDGYRTAATVVCLPHKTSGSFAFRKNTEDRQALTPQRVAGKPNRQAEIVKKHGHFALKMPIAMTLTATNGIPIGGTRFFRP